MEPTPLRLTLALVSLMLAVTDLLSFNAPLAGILELILAALLYYRPKWGVRLLFSLIALYLIAAVYREKSHPALVILGSIGVLACSYEFYSLLTGRRRTLLPFRLLALGLILVAMALLLAWSEPHTRSSESYGSFLFWAGLLVGNAIALLIRPSAGTAIFWLWAIPTGLYASFLALRTPGPSPYTVLLVVLAAILFRTSYILYTHWEESAIPETVKLDIGA